MNKEAQRIAIAEACGYKWYKTYRAKYGHRLNNPFGERMLLNDAQSEIHLCEPTEDMGLIVNLAAVPDYLNDLNAMHDAEGVLDTTNGGPKSGDCLRYAYSRELYKLVPEWMQPFRATASQRAEALLRTMGKWQEPPTPSK